jgi:hypothetical protein
LTLPNRLDPSWLPGDPIDPEPVLVGCRRRGTKPSAGTPLRYRLATLGRGHFAFGAVEITYLAFREQDLLKLLAR